MLYKLSDFLFQTENQLNKTDLTMVRKFSLHNRIEKLTNILQYHRFNFIWQSGTKYKRLQNYAQTHCNSNQNRLYANANTRKSQRQSEVEIEQYFLYFRAIQSAFLRNLKKNNFPVYTRRMVKESMCQLGDATQKREFHLTVLNWYHERRRYI